MQHVIYKVFSISKRHRIITKNYHECVLCSRYSFENLVTLKDIIPFLHYHKLNFLNSSFFLYLTGLCRLKISNFLLKQVTIYQILIFLCSQFSLKYFIPPPFDRCLGSMMLLHLSLEQFIMYSKLIFKSKQGG